MSDNQPIRPAATIILWRYLSERFEILMGQRGSSAIFMPSKFVFPGGGVDLVDSKASETVQLAPDCATRLSLYCHDGAPSPSTLVEAALRELHEETGLTLPSQEALRFVFRAITPPGRSRRFDARFFLADASNAIGDGVGFKDATAELSHLHWIGLADARTLDLPFITEVVLAEITAILSGYDQPGVPFFDNSGTVPTFRRLI